MAEEGIYIQLVCKLEFGVRHGHNVYFRAVLNFSHRRLFLLEKCKIRLLSGDGGLVRMFCHKRR